MSSIKFLVTYEKRAWYVRADVYVKGFWRRERMVGGVLKEREETDEGYGDWLPAKMDFNMYTNNMDSTYLKFVRMVLDELERIANALDANPAIPSDNAGADIVTGVVSSANL